MSIENYSRDALLQLIADLEAENDALKKQLSAHVPLSEGGEPLPVSGGNDDAAAGKPVAVEEWRQRFDFLFRTDESLITTAIDGTIIDCNDSAELLYGLPRAELIGTSLLSYSADAARSKLQNLMEQPAAGRRTEDRLVISIASGQHISIARRILTLSDNGIPSGFLVADENISKPWLEEELLNLLRTALSRTVSSIAITNLKGMILYANKAFLMMTGYPHAECVFNNISMLRPGGSAADGYEEMDETLKTGDAWRGELLTRRKDGTLFVCEQTVSPVSDSGGRLQYYMIVAQDVTEKMEAEKRLKAIHRKNQELASIINLSPAIGIKWSDQETWRLDYISNNIDRLGYSPEEFLQGERTLFSIFNPEDGERARKDLSKHFAMKRSSYTGTYRIVTAKGEVRWFDLYVLLRLEESPVEIQAVALDITQRKVMQETLHSEREFFKLVLDQAGDGIIACDETGSITLINPAAQRFLNLPEPFTPVEQWGTYHRLYNSGGSEELTTSQLPLLRALGEGHIANFEMIIKTSDEHEQFIVATAQPLFGPEGRQIGAIAVLNDQTVRKRAEEQERRHQEQLIQADKMVALGTLVSGVAHEINNPNNFIMLNIPILEKTWAAVRPILDEHQQQEGDFLVGSRLKYSKVKESIPELLQGIAEGAQRIKNIVLELKDFARAEPVAQDQEININNVVKSAHMLTANLLKKYTNRFKINYASYCPPVRGSVQQIEQVVINLIENACQALPEKSRTIEITLRYDAPTRRALIMVADEGVGMTPDTLKKITDPFFTTRRSSGGTGLGLSVSSKIIMNHNGQLTFESEPGKGTTATVSLPVAAQQETGEDE